MTTPRRTFAALLSGFLLVGACFGITACDRSPSGRPVADAPPTVKRVSLHYEIEGMHCSGCVDAIVDKVSKVPGVKTCAVDLDSKRAVFEGEGIELDSGIRAAIERLGYKVQPATPPTPGH